MTVAIFTAEDKHLPIGGMKLSAPERIVLKYWEAFPRFGMPEGMDKTHTMPAEIRQGRWIVDCPWCTSCQMASEEDHRFFCTHCSNGAVGGKWIGVIWPDDREEIEAVVGRRPNPKNRNFLPGETVVDLRAENLLYGVS